MDIFSTLLILIAFSLVSFFLVFSFLILSIFTRKSLSDPTYPPVKGTVFSQLFHFKTLYDYQTEISKTHKTFRFLAPNKSKLFTTDVKNIEHILKTQFEKYSKGEFNHCLVTDLLGDGIFAVDAEKWRQQRKLASYEFSTRVLRDFSCSVFRRNAAKLAGVISEFCHGGLVFDMQDVLMKCTLDSIFRVGFGVDLNCLEGSSKEGTTFMKAFDDSNAFIYMRYINPFWKLKKLLNIGSEAALRNNIKIINDFVQCLINTKRQLSSIHKDSNDKEDILSRFLLESKKDPESMTDQYLRDIILNFMIAGKDTSASTLSWFFYMLCKNPVIQEKIAQEVKDVISKGNEPKIDEFVNKITDSTLEKMHYLHAALTETLRLYPAVPVNGRTADAPDILPDGYKVKKGDGVYYLAYAMGRMSYIWGDDAEEFKPGRWLRDGIFQPESSFKFIAFHAGPRICLGKDFAYRQMKIVSMVLLRFFRFKLANEMENVTYRTMFTLHIDNGLHVCAVSRS